MPINKTRTELFDTFVGNIAYHATLYSTGKDLVRCTSVFGMPPVTIRIEQKRKHPDVWDQCYLVDNDGTERSLGNRHAAVNVYSEIAARALRRWAAWSGEDK